MGWWSTCIMGGDTPYDIVGIMEDKLGGLSDLHVAEFEPTQGRIISHAIRVYGGVSRLINDISAGFDRDKCAITAQVVGLIAISAGATLTEVDKSLILARSAADEWAKEDKERREKITSFREAVRSYDGTPMRLTQEGLFETMVQRGFLKG